jgi:cyclic beta-1,2-glucan synthetase
VGWRPKALQAQPAPSELPPTLRSLLQASQGPLLAPVRAEIFGPQRFAEHGQSLGLTHTAGRATWDSPSFFPRLRSNIGMLRQARQALATQAAAGDDVSPASLWLLDNFHLIEAQLLAVHEGLPRHYFRALPVLLGEPLAGLPRIYGVAWAFVAHTDSAFDEDLLVHFLCAYQQTRELRLSEMWALPTTLRVVLVENLRRLAEHLATQQAARELANRCCDHIDAGQAPNRPALDALLHQTEQRGVAMAFLAQMGQRLQDRPSGADEGVPAHVRQWLQAVLPHLGELQAQQAAQQTADNLSVSNAVASLRTIGDADWPALVARSSPLMQLMLTAPLFAAEHHHTRDDTLHAIETLARRSGKSEMQVAQALLVLMASTPGAAPQGPATDTKAPAYDAQEAGHWLQGPGQATLAHALGLHAHWRLRLQAARRHAVLPLYLGTIALGTWALVARLLPAAPLATPAPATWAPWVMAGVALLLAVPASETVIALLHRLISESTRPRRLPRLALASGIPAEHRVMVVMPAMLSDAAAISGLVHRLQLHHLANPEAHAQFALLSDWGDADQAQSPRDQPLLLQATAAVAALNARLSQPGDDPAAPRFLLLHRKRRYSRSERRWIGWERKRGKLEQLVAALAATPIDAPGDTPGDTPADTPSRPAFVDLGALSTPAAGTRYVVTLDSDTQLPPGRLRELVGVAAHPSNCPRLAPHGKNGSTRVMSGYGILQPRLVTPLPLPSEDTFFHRCLPASAASTPTAPPVPRSTRTCSARAASPARACCTCRPCTPCWTAACPKTRCSATTCWKARWCAARRERHDADRGRPLPRRRGGVARAPLDARRLAVAAHPAAALLRPRVTRWRGEPLEDVDNLRRSLVAPASLVLLLLALAGVPHPPLAWRWRWCWPPFLPAR